MANEVYTRTNQALYFARKAIESWRGVESSAALDALTQARYHREHALFHLYRGVLAVIHEVADRYRWPLLDIRTVEAGLASDVVERFPGPELAELHEMANSPASWLGELLVAWEVLHAPPRPMESKPPVEGVIYASGEATVSEWGVTEAETALKALQERVGCYREGMVEW